MFDINFEQYKVFYFVAKNLSFSKASKELFISQSAVSQSIKNLETRIGESLFFRHAKTISLTTSGEVLYENVKVAFSYLTHAENKIKSDSSRLELRIAASDTISKYFLLPYIEKYCRLYPNIKIKIINKYSSQSVELLKELSCDISVISTEISDPTLKVTKIKSISDVFVAGPIYSHLKNQKLELLELENYPILALEKSTTTRKNLIHLESSNNLNLITEIEVQSMGLLKDFARIGLGFAYITDLAISKSSDLFILDINHKLPKNHISVVTLKTKSIPTHAQNFIDLITQTVL